MCIGRQSARHRRQAYEYGASNASATSEVSLEISAPPRSRAPVMHAQWPCGTDVAPHLLRPCEEGLVAIGEGPPRLHVRQAAVGVQAAHRLLRYSAVQCTLSLVRPACMRAQPLWGLHECRACCGVCGVVGLVRLYCGGSNQVKPWPGTISSLEATSTATAAHAYLIPYRGHCLCHSH